VVDVRGNVQKPIHETRTRGRGRSVHWREQPKTLDQFSFRLLRGPTAGGESVKAWSEHLSHRPFGDHIQHNFDVISLYHVRHNNHEKEQAQVSRLKWTQNNGTFKLATGMLMRGNRGAASRTLLNL
jgi:hypothetical protein